MTYDDTVETRLEYLCPDGSWQLLGVHPLLHPERYPGRLSSAGKVARAVEVGGQNRIWEPDNIPSDPSILVATTEGGPVPWRLPSCSACGGGVHSEGECLL